MEIVWTLCFDGFFFGGYIYISQQDVQYKGHEKGAFVD